MKNNPYRMDGHKLIYHMERVYAHYRDHKPIYPLHIDIGATKKCNAKCVYCYGIHQKMSSDVIPRNVLVSLFKDAPKLGIKSLTLTGDGEPTLNPDVYAALIAGEACGLDIGFATNGIDLDDSKLRIILNSSTWLRFNLSAVDVEGYKSVHGVSQWKRVEDNILRAVYLEHRNNYKCTIGIQMVLIPECRKHIIPEAKWAIANGLDYFVIKQFSDPENDTMSRFDLNWYLNPELVHTLHLAEGMSTNRTKVIPKWNMMGSKGKRPYDRCVDCALIFQISGNSKCYPCGFLFNNEKYCYGDLKKQSLKQILNSKRYWEVVKHMRYEFDVHKECKGCCRHDFTNAFIWDYLHAPEHLNFI